MNRTIDMKVRGVALAAALALLSVTEPVNAVELPITGGIGRTLSAAGSALGGCMILLTTPQPSTGVTGCTTNTNGWYSLDCNGGFNQNAGERNYASALMAFSLNKQVSLMVENTQKYGNFCVVKRVDVIK